MAMRTAVTMACPIYILFPSPDATDLSEAVKISGQAERASTPADKSTEGSCSPEAWSYLLIAIDGTWREAKEMYKVRIQAWELYCRSGHMIPHV